jgi:tRNA 2-thiocytidine biosynthesis protein TtcA
LLRGANLGGQRVLEADPRQESMQKIDADVVCQGGGAKFDRKRPESARQHSQRYRNGSVGCKPLYSLEEAHNRSNNNVPSLLTPDSGSNIGVPFHIEEQDTYSIVKRLIPEGQTTCLLCSRLRREHLYRVDTESRETKIALGHHRDNIVETLFLNLFYTSKFKTMPLKLCSKDGRHVVIRPLAAVRESDLVRYTELRAFPFIPRDLCGSQEDLKRKQVKEFLREWERRAPGCTDSMFAALSNVAPPFLLDRRLFDFVGLRASDQAEGHEDAWLDHKSNA